jgi:hypothetical protein
MSFCCTLLMLNDCSSQIMFVLLESLRKDSRIRLNYEGLANGLLVVAATKATLEEAAYTQPTDNYLFHNRDIWSQVPLNNISMVKEDHTEEGAEVQPKKQQVGSEYNWNHYVTVIPFGRNTTAGRAEIVESMATFFNSTVTEDNGYRFLRMFRRAEDRTRTPPRTVDGCFLEHDVIAFMSHEYPNESLVDLREYDDIVAKYFKNVEEGKEIMTRHHNDRHDTA